MLVPSIPSITPSDPSISTPSPLKKPVKLKNTKATSSVPVPPPKQIEEEHTIDPPKKLPIEPIPTRQSTRGNKGVNKQFNSNEWDIRPLTRKQTKDVNASLVAIKNNPHGPLAVLAQRANIKKALSNKDRRSSILKALNGEIDKLKHQELSNPFVYVISRFLYVKTLSLLSCSM